MFMKAFAWRMSRAVFDFTAAVAWSIWDIIKTACTLGVRPTLKGLVVLACIVGLAYYKGLGAAASLQLVTIALTIMVPITLWGTGPSRWAWALSAVYVASYFIGNSWHIAFWMLEPLPAEVAEAVKRIMEGAPPSAYGFALRIDQANKRLLVALYAFILLCALRGDLQARMIMLVLAIAEGFEFLANIECKLLKDPFGSRDLHLSTIWGVEVSRYACGRVFTAWAPLVSAGVPAVFLIWINMQLAKSRNKGKRE